MLKRLDYCQILNVTDCLPPAKEEAADGEVARITEMKPLYDHLGEVPEGHYVPRRNGLLLPKRKKGEKFCVRYTTVHQVDL